MKGSVTNLVARNGYYWDEVNQCYWNTPFVIGDVVKYKGGGGHYGGNLAFVYTANDYTIEGISIGSSIDSVYTNNVYYSVYTQSLHLHGVSKNYTAKHFKLLRKGTPVPTTLSIDMDRPCLVFELVIDDAGKKTVKDTTKALPFGSMTLAKAYVEEQIVTSIRENNVYPQYAVYEERFIGRAEKPPVVFE